MTGQEPTRHTRSVDLTTAIMGLVQRYGEARDMAASMSSIGSVSARTYKDEADALYCRIQRTLETAVNLTVASQVDIRTRNRGPLPGWPDPDARPRY